MITIIARGTEVETRAQGNSAEIMRDTLNMAKNEIITPQFSAQLLGGAVEAEKKRQAAHKKK